MNNRYIKNNTQINHNRTKTEVRPWHLKKKWIFVLCGFSEGEGGRGQLPVVEGSPISYDFEVEHLFCALKKKKKRYRSIAFAQDW